jgi:pimeloyl-ACP methyl ester carboxylesterase
MLIQHEGAQLVEIPDCGHAPLLMSPFEIDVIARFVGADSAARAVEADAMQTA